MPYTKSEAPPDLRDQMQALEERADGCFKLIRLLNRQLETWQQKRGPNSPLHNVRMVTMDRCTCGFKFISEHGTPVSRLADKYTWTGSLIEDANHAIRIPEEYTHFLNVFPMWHKNQERVDRRQDGRIRIYLPQDSPRQRQVIAYQQRYRPKKSDLSLQYGRSKKPESTESMRLLGELWHQVRPSGSSGKFRYEPSHELIDAMRPKYEERLADNFRRADTFQLDGYSLGQFKAFYYPDEIFVASIVPATLAS